MKIKGETVAAVEAFPISPTQKAPVIHFSSTHKSAGDLTALRFDDAEELARFMELLKRTLNQCPRDKTQVVFKVFGDPE